MTERINSFVKGLDKQLGGGIPKGTISLLYGHPGTMKSTLAYNILYHNAKKHGTKGVYITLEQTEQSLYDHLRNLGYDPEEMMEHILFMDIGSMRYSTDISADAWYRLFKTVIGDFKKQENFKLLAVDSIDALEVIGEIENRRMDFFRIFQWLRTLEITAFMISDRGDMMNNGGKYEEGILADAIFEMRMVPRGDTKVIRQFRCVKMRSSYHNTNYMQFQFKDGKFWVQESNGGGNGSGEQWD